MEWGCSGDSEKNVQAFGPCGLSAKVQRKDKSGPASACLWYTFRPTESIASALPA